MGAVAAVGTRWLEDGRSARRKQRHTAYGIFWNCPVEEYSFPGVESTAPGRVRCQRRTHVRG